MSSIGLDFATLKALYARCRPDEALDPGDDRFVDLDAAPDGDGGPRGERWIEALRREVRLSGDKPVRHYFSGLRGSGKSTELRRLRENLDRDGYLVVLVDVDQRVDLNAAIDLADLMFLMLYDAERAVLLAEQRAPDDAAQVSLFSRMWHWVTNADVPLTTDLGADFQIPVVPVLHARIVTEFKTATLLRDRVRAAVVNRPTAFLDEVRTAFESLRERTMKLGRQGLVLIVDSLEHLQPMSHDFKDVIASTERLYESGVLELPVHTLYTVPPAVVLRLRTRATFIPMVKLAPRGMRGEQHRFEPGYAVLRELVRRRIGEPALAALFGPEAMPACVDRIIFASGGYPRALVSLLLTFIAQAEENVVPAVSPREFDRVLLRQGAQFDQLVNTEGARAVEMLHAVDATTLLKTSTDEERELASRLLDLNLLFRYQDEVGWWSVHPSIAPSLRALQDHRLTRVEFADVGPIRALSLDLRPGWNLLVGDNSSGKTSILRAIALALAGTDPRASVASARVLRVGATRGTVSVSIDRDTFTTTLERGLSGVTAKASRETLTQRGRWLTLGFPAVRGVVARAITGPAAAQPDAPGAWDVLPLVEGASDARLDDTRQWIVNTAIRAEGNDNPERHQRLLARWFEIVAELMPGLDFKYARVDRQSWQVFVTTADGELPIDQLSQGMVATLGWIGTVLRRLYDVFPESEAPEKEPVLVLIDELDSHLHPAWQREVIPLVRKQFPNAQVIATTHSALLVNALEDPERDAIFRCSRDALGAVSVTRITQDLRGHRADQVLTSPAFELETSRSVYAADRRKRHLEALAHRHESPEASALSDELSAEMQALIPSPPETPEARESAAEAERRADATMKARIAQSSVEELQKLREVLLAIQGGRS